MSQNAVGSDTHLVRRVGPAVVTGVAIAGVALIGTVLNEPRSNICADAAATVLPHRLGFERNRPLDGARYTATSAKFQQNGIQHIVVKLAPSGGASVEADIMTQPDKCCVPGTAVDIYSASVAVSNNPQQALQEPTFEVLNQRPERSVPLDVKAAAIGLARRSASEYKTCLGATKPIAIVRFLRHLVP
jgi:hypothetical protein